MILRGWVQSALLCLPTLLASYVQLIALEDSPSFATIETVAIESGLHGSGTLGLAVSSLSVSLMFVSKYAFINLPDLAAVEAIASHFLGLLAVSRHMAAQTTVVASIGIQRLVVIAIGRIAMAIDIVSVGFGGCLSGCLALGNLEFVLLAVLVSGLFLVGKGLVAFFAVVLVRLDVPTARVRMRGEDVCHYVLWCRLRAGL